MSICLLSFTTYFEFPFTSDPTTDCNDGAPDPPLPEELEEDWHSCCEDDSPESPVENKLPRPVRDTPTILHYIHPTLPDIKYGRETIKDPGTKRDNPPIWATREKLIPPLCLTTEINLMQATF
jgi:hypothetical protein